MSVLGGRLRALVIVAIAAAVAATAGIVWWATSDDLLPFKPSALQAAVHVQISRDDRAQPIADALAGRDRLTVPRVEGEHAEVVVGWLTFEHPKGFRRVDDGRLALFVIDNDSHTTVTALYGVASPADDISSGWDSAYNSLASKYSWLSPLAPIHTDSGFTDPGMSIAFSARTTSPVSFVARLNPDSLPITSPATQLTLVLAYLDGNNKARWAERLTISN